MQNLDPNSEKIILDAIRLAGTKLMQFWPGSFRSRGQEGLNVTKKEDGSYVTQADHASNEILTAVIQKHFPNDGILSEESPIEGDLSLKKRVWIIDPLDGTQTFIDGNEDFSILVALTEAGRPIFGAMHLPARDQLALAMKGRGSSLNNSRMLVSSSDSIRHEGLYMRHCCVSDSAIVFPRWLDSSLAILRLCRGEFDAVVVRVVAHKEWDLAVPALLVEESGGKVTDEKGQALQFGSGEVGFRYFVASNGRVHQQLLRLVADSMS